MLKLKIRNFPPIRRESEIDLSKDFLIFVGPNNSGKTYVSQLIWNIFYKLSSLRVLERILDKAGVKLKEERKKSNISFIILDDRFFSNLEKAINEVILEELVNLFGREFLDLKSIDVKIEIDQKALKETYRESSYNSLDYFGSWVKDAIVKKRGKAYRIRIEFENHEKKVTPRVKTAFLHSIRETVISPLLKRVNKTVYFPAFRTSIPIIASQLIKAQADRLMEGFSGERRIYTEPVEKLIFNELVDIAEKQSFIWKTLPPDKVESMLEKLLGGKLQISVFDEVVPLPIISYKTAEKELPMHLSSSMVNQLALFYLLYDVYRIYPGKLFFIIDEPEIHLHPNSKVKFAELLLSFVNQGNKLLITTHSTLLSRTLENYFLYGKLKKTLPQKELEELQGTLFIDPELVIDPDRVGAYFFTGKEIISYEDRNFGILLTDFAQVQEEVFNTSQILREKVYERVMQNVLDNGK